MNGWVGGWVGKATHLFQRHAAQGFDLWILFLQALDCCFALLDTQGVLRATQVVLDLEVGGWFENMGEKKKGVDESSHTR